MSQRRESCEPFQFGTDTTPFAGDATGSEAPHKCCRAPTGAEAAERSPPRRHKLEHTEAVEKRNHLHPSTHIAKFLIFFSKNFEKNFPQKMCETRGVPDPLSPGVWIYIYFPPGAAGTRARSQGSGGCVEPEAGRKSVLIETRHSSLIISG